MANCCVHLLLPFFLLLILQNTISWQKKECRVNVIYRIDVICHNHFATRCHKFQLVGYVIGTKSLHRTTCNCIHFVEFSEFFFFCLLSELLCSFFYHYQSCYIFGIRLCHEETSNNMTKITP